MLDIVTFGHPSLKMKSTDVTSFDNELKNLTDMMLEIMYAAPGVGLAAPQIGINKNVFVFDVGDGPNINTKVFSFATKDEYINKKFNDYILGPKSSNDLFEYEIRLILSNKLNYNKIMSLFSDVCKFEPIKIRNI